jgi:hypothetical protein
VTERFGALFDSSDMDHVSRWKNLPNAQQSRVEQPDCEISDEQNPNDVDEWVEILSVFEA